MTQSAPSNYVFWLAGRSAGIVAMLLVTASVLIGLAMAARVMPPRWRRTAVRLHEHLALISLGAIGAHGLLLAADPWLKAGVKGIAIPFVISYRPLWTGLGIIGGYLTALLALSFYLRRRIGPRLWRRMHRFTVVGYALSLVHALGSGTDMAIPAVRYAVLASALPVVFLLALRYQRGRVGSPAPARREAAPASAAGETGPGELSGGPRAVLPAPGRRAGSRTVAPPRGSIQPSPSQAS